MNSAPNQALRRPYRYATALLAGLIACSEAADLHVRVTDDGYRLGTLHASQPQPVVDAVRAAQARHVVLWHCANEATAALAALQQELRTVSGVDVRVATLREGCVATK